MIEIKTDSMTLAEVEQLKKAVDKIKNIDHSLTIKSIKNTTQFKIVLKEV